MGRGQGSGSAEIFEQSRVDLGGLGHGTETGPPVSFTFGHLELVLNVA